MAVSAYVAKPTMWRRWTKKWNAAKQPIKVFHSTDCANFRGEFKDWTKQQRDAFVTNLLPIMPAHKLFGIVIAVQMEDFRAALKGRDELQEMLGNLYTCCFQWSVMSIMELASNYAKGTRIKFIHEVNDYKGEAQKTFEYVSQLYRPERVKMALAFGIKTENPPLQAADILAYEGGKFLRDLTRPPRRAWTALDPDDTRIVSYRYAKENMADLVSELTAFRERLGAQQ